MLNELLLDISPEDYLRLEAQSPVRHEYLNGAVFAMSEADERHATLATNLASALGVFFATEPERVAAAGTKVHVASDNAYYYPDVMVGRSGGSAAPGVIDQPVVLVEVLSPATASIDRREKLLSYRRIASLREYVLVEQDTAHVEVFRRAGDARWQRVALGRDEVLELLSIDFSLPLAAIYEGTGI